MKLPLIKNNPAVWPNNSLTAWSELNDRSKKMIASVGHSNAFENILQQWRNMAITGKYQGVQELLKRRIGVRALTYLWLSDESLRARLLNVKLLDLLMNMQQPQVSRLTLIQLIQLYFRFFDELNENNQDFLEKLQNHLHQQLEKANESSKSRNTEDTVFLLNKNQWLIQEDGPFNLVSWVRKQGKELGETFSYYGLNGFDTGRYADICRTHFYLETLRELHIGEWDAVLDELLKSSVSKAPYKESKRIGHAALEILIDRVADNNLSENWQYFILQLAGDPRIASSTPNYIEWWKPLGKERIDKVRSWLSKEDLRLFLQAVEQYGIDQEKYDLRRMFPARKLFLEGLFKLKLIRNTRLMLGSKAKKTINQILGKEVKTNFASLDNGMTDKAVIYLDCGDFHLIEGSHSFKIWIYLALPSQKICSYEKSQFSHHELTNVIPAEYKRNNPNLPMDSYVHNHSLTWQNKVFQFLADNGIELNIENLLRPEEYRDYLSKFGMPTIKINHNKT